jgi:hemerythrin
VEHFEDEENISRLYKYPLLEEHIKAHGDFTDTVAAFIEQYKIHGNSEELSSEINRVIVQWLMKHIQSEDFKIAQHIKRLEKR